MTAPLRTMLRGMLLAGAGPAQALAHVSDLAGGSAGAPGTQTCLAQLDPASGEVNYASSGLLPPLLCTPGEARFLAGPGHDPPGRDDHPGAATAVLPSGGVLLLCLGRAAGHHGQPRRAHRPGGSGGIGHGRPR